MGLSLSTMLNHLWGEKQMRILMLGLNASGKTTIQFKLKMGVFSRDTYPIGFNVDISTYNSIQLAVWDVGGQEEFRPLWRQYFPNASSIIFVVDSNDRDRIAKAQAELQRILNEDGLRDAALLVFANKQDLPNAMDTTEIADKLGLQSLTQRAWYIQSTCASSGEGLFEGLEWIATTLRKTSAVDGNEGAHMARPKSIM